MEIEDRIQRAETTAAARDFADTARILALAKGSVSEARRLAYELSSPRVVATFDKAEPGSLGGTSPQWGEELSDYQQTAEGFIASLRADGAFDAALPFMVRVPFRTKLAISTSAVVATEKSEGEDKSVFDLAFTAAELEPRKVSATVVISTELARIGGDNANALILRELRNGVIAGTDSVSIAALIAATTPIPSSGNVLTDLAALLAAVPSGSSSRLFFVIEPSQAKILATSPGVNGAAFPQMNVNGGSIGGVTILVSGQLAAGTAVLFDATAIAAASENVALSASREAVVTTVASPASSVSLWPQDLVALRAERWFGFSLLRADRVASLSGVDYTPTSP
jgi:hypothetical protein